MRQLTLEMLRPLMNDIAMSVHSKYPNEGCGIVLERDGALSVIALENEQNQLHERDPIRFPGTAATAYSINPLTLYETEKNGSRIRAIFHSHVNRGAYFSDEDMLGALGGDLNGEPVFPGVDYLVLSVRKDGVYDAKLFTWQPERRDFKEA